MNKEIVMLNILETIRKNNLVKSGDIIGVGCSGGGDSIALLHALSKLQRELDIEVVAISIDHSIRENSALDVQFVKEKASEFGVRFYKFKVDAPKIAKEKGVSLETGAREARYGVFRALIRKGLVDKIALAHHRQDQAETILMHLFRGSGSAGVLGMPYISENVFIRPLLDFSKDDILEYCNENHLDFVEDYTNQDNSYNRNFVRNVVLKEITSRWPNAVNAIVNFGAMVKKDDDFINKQINMDACIFEDKTAKIPLSYFLFDKAIMTRIIFNCLKTIGINKDIEKKHIDAIFNLALYGENGKRVSLPFEASAIKEYDYLTIVNKHVEIKKINIPYKSGEFDLPNGKTLIVKRVKELKKKEGQLIFDYRKLPKDAVWRYREEGDVFTKFGGGSKKLKSYLIDKKVPLRLRDQIPVLASGNEILVIAGVEISDKVKVDEILPNYAMVELI